MQFYDSAQSVHNVILRQLFTFKLEVVRYLSDCLVLVGYVGINLQQTTTK